MRDQMISVIQDAVGGCDRYWAELIAKALIVHGAIMPPNASASEYKLTTVNAEVSYTPPLDIVGIGAERMVERDVRRELIHKLEDILGSALILDRRDEHTGGPFGRTIISGKLAVVVPKEVQLKLRRVSGDENNQPPR